MDDSNRVFMNCTELLHCSDNNLLRVMHGILSIVNTKKVLRVEHYISLWELRRNNIGNFYSSQYTRNNGEYFRE